MRVGIVVPHIFMHRDILPHVIFAPAKLALDIAEGVQKEGAEVTLFSPGPVDTSVKNITADLSYFEKELQGRGDNYIDLLKKHAFTFVTLARQVQSELIAKAFAMANNDELDVVHVYTNEEDTALPFAQLCTKPVVFTHHDPFNFLVKYKNVFPKYKDLNWISMSYAQRASMPKDTNWVGNIYHGIDDSFYAPVVSPSNDYVAYLGRIIEPKGVHLAIAAVKQYNQTADKPLRLKIAGKHYAGHKKDTYWQEKILPELNDPNIEYVGFIGDAAAKQAYLANAKALIVPSVFDEPFGMVMIEALACATPVIGLDSGAIPEIIDDTTTGYIIKKTMSENNELDENKAILDIALQLSKLRAISRNSCRQAFESRFTCRKMCTSHYKIYQELMQKEL
jgi:glycosyltransferase involved in cell wall biosynthesis